MLTAAGMNSSSSNLKVCIRAKKIVYLYAPKVIFYVRTHKYIFSMINKEENLRRKHTPRRANLHRQSSKAGFQSGTCI
jgi:Ca2+/H+ antiporter